MKLYNNQGFMYEHGNFYKINYVGRKKTGTVCLLLFV